MKKYQKIFIGIILFLFVFAFTGIKPAKAITIAEIQTQITAMIAQIIEIQKQLNELALSEATNAPKSVAVVYPDGGEKLEAGKTYDIKWNAAGYSVDTEVQIDLIDDRYDSTSPKHQFKIVNTTNSGQYSWKVPDALNSNTLWGSLYKISITIGEGSSQLSDISSSYFSIIVIGATPYLNIISPNGTEMLMAGKVYRIKWDSPGFEGYKVNIVLKENLSQIRNLASSASNNSCLDWTVPWDVPGGNFYVVSITLTDNYGTAAAFNQSNVFMINH